jgi:hypothetical protein
MIRLAAVRVPELLGDQSEADRRDLFEAAGGEGVPAGMDPPYVSRRMVSLGRAAHCAAVGKRPKDLRVGPTLRAPF